MPAILLRTPYKESLLGFKRMGVLRYVEAGYALVMQMVRGVGDSEGSFSFNAPHERTERLRHGGVDRRAALVQRRCRHGRQQLTTR